MRVDIGDGTRLFFDVAESSLSPTPEAMETILRRFLAS